MAHPAARAAKVASKYAVKYGPHAVAAAKVAGPAAKEIALKQQQRLRNKRLAFDKAETVIDGSVLRLQDGDEPVWVVFTGDEAIAAYPESTTPLPELIATANLSSRVTPAQRDAARLRARAARAGTRARRNRQSPKQLPSKD